MKIFFRADASLEIGTGHVQRCLTLAESLSLESCECHFVCREHPGNLIALLERKGFTVHKLPVSQPASSSGTLAHSHWLGSTWEADAEQTIKAIGDDLVDWLIVDHYALDKNWEKSLRSKTHKIMAIDDIADREHDCDLLLDQNLFSDPEKRYEKKIPAQSTRLLGPTYALLQPSYTELTQNVPPRKGRAKRLLAYFGGADTSNLTGRTIDAFISLKRGDLKLDVIVNRTNPRFEELKEQISGSDNIELFCDLPSLAPLMISADLAIGAGGATSWERCCLGLPALVITLAENQRPIAQELDRVGVIRWLGHKDDIGSSEIINALKNALNEDLDPTCSEKCKKLVDGLGVERVKKHLMMERGLLWEVRRARPEDAELYLKLKKDSALTVEHFERLLRSGNGEVVLVALATETYPAAIIEFKDKGPIEVFPAPVFSGTDLIEQMIPPAISFYQRKVSQVRKLKRKGIGPGLSISLCSDKNSWINVYLPQLVADLMALGHTVDWVHSASELAGGDVCFYLSYGRIVDSNVRSRFKKSLVVHESDLPKGRGWAPMTWQILEGADKISVSLIEAQDEVDSGDIISQTWITLEGTELSSEWRRMQAEATIELSRNFVENYPDSLKNARKQTGEASVYARRRPKDSEIDPSKSLEDQFELLRVVDNEAYPAYFNHRGTKYILKITKDEP